MTTQKNYGIKLRYIEKNADGTTYDAADYLTIEAKDIIEAIQQAKARPEYNQVKSRTGKPEVFEAYEIQEAI